MRTTIHICFGAASWERKKTINWTGQIFVCLLVCLCVVGGVFFRFCSASKKGYFLINSPIQWGTLKVFEIMWWIRFLYGIKWRYIEREREKNWWVLRPKTHYGPQSTKKMIFAEILNMDVDFNIIFLLSRRTLWMFHITCFIKKIFIDFEVYFVSVCDMCMSLS